MRFRLVACTFLLLVVLHPSPAASHPLAIAALERLDSVDNDAWSYTMTTRSKEGVTIERHDAAAPTGERWTLLQKDGRTPTQKELREYGKEKAERDARREAGEGDDEEDVDRSSIRLVSEDDRAATFQFRIASSGRMEAAFTKHILGTLVVNKNGSWAERFELKSTKPIRPIPGVSIREFNLAMTFWRDAQSGEVMFET
ncbi:MAG: hypothetical protein ACSLFQ_01305, partial [Thermoanaerobaculia bacterium]